VSKKGQHRRAAGAERELESMNLRPILRPKRNGGARIVGVDRGGECQATGRRSHKKGSLSRAIQVVNPDRAT
jgi:hypothetical protein